MEIVFPFEEQKTKIFGAIKRPVADVHFWSERYTVWVPIKMIVDTGADYTLLPSWLAEKLGIRLDSDCRSFQTSGIGGSETSYIVRKLWKVKLDHWQGAITLGFLNSHTVPPLLGRLNFLEQLAVTFKNFSTRFAE